jgi:hypothetical protein
MLVPVVVVAEKCLGQEGANANDRHHCRQRRRFPRRGSQGKDEGGSGIYEQIASLRTNTEIETLCLKIQRKQPKESL